MNYLLNISAFSFENPNAAFPAYGDVKELILEALMNAGFCVLDRTLEAPPAWFFTFEENPNIGAWDVVIKVTISMDGKDLFLQLIKGQFNGFPEQIELRERITLDQSDCWTTA